MTIGSVKSESSAGFPVVVVVNGFLFVVVVVARCGKGGKVYGPFPRFPQYRSLSYSGSRPSYMIASSPYTLPQLWIGIVHFFVASNVDR